MNSSSPLVIVLGKRRVTAFLLVIVAFLTVGHGLALISIYGFQASFGLGVVPLFHLDREGNIPTAYAALSLLLSATLFFVIARSRKRANRSDSSSWLLLAYIFVFLALDEAASIHEICNFLLQFLGTSGMLAWPWVIVYSGLVLIFVARFYRLFWNLKKRHRCLFFCSGALYLVGAMGMELVGAAVYVNNIGATDYWAIIENQPERVADTLTYALASSVEELLEMSGILLLIYSLFDYIELEIQERSLLVQIIPEAKDART